MYIEITQNVNGCWYWRLMATNGQILAHSESYSSKAKCKQTTKSVAKSCNLEVREP